MKLGFAIAITTGLALASPLAIVTDANAASNIVRNTRIGPGQDEQSGFEAAAPGIAAQGRYQGRSGWRNHHHHRRYYHRRY